MLVNPKFVFFCSSRICLIFFRPPVPTLDFHGSCFMSIDEPSIAFRECVHHNSRHGQFSNASQDIVETLGHIASHEVVSTSIGIK